MHTIFFSNIPAVCISLMLCFVASCPAFGGSSTDDPSADPRAVVTCGKARFTVLTPELLRIEYSPAGRFEDRATFTVINRRLSVPEFSISDDSTFLYISTGCLKLKYRKGTDPRTVPASPANLTVNIDNGGVSTVWYPGKPDPLNLKGTCRTLDGLTDASRRSELENGLVSRSGWAVVDDSWSATRPDGGRSYALVDDADMGYQWWSERADAQAMDVYLFGYGHNYKQAVSDYTRISGGIPLPPDYVFGYWYSKYASYSADDYRQIMSDLQSNNIPTDVMILDMDWHWNGNASSMSEGRGGWTGWSWNTNLIPDPRGLLSEMHSKHFKTALNLHPADGVNRTESPSYFDQMNRDLSGKYLNSAKDNISWSLDYRDFTRSFFNTIIRDHESEGVDFWWLDWQQYLTSPYTNSLSETFWCNHVFFNEASKRGNLRPVIFHRWGGMGSHRYQIGFSGDANISYEALDFEPYFTATASNVGYGYWGHDLGGHMYSNDELINNPNLVLRWIQFGVFTPIFRTHATSDSRIERRIWKFPNFPTILSAVRLRYSLFPYIYTMAREAYDTGISLCRPLYYEYPETEEAYIYENEYFFGSDILVAPITTAAGADGMTQKEIWFPEGRWWSVSTNEMIEGPCKRTMTFTDAQIPYFFRQGAIIPYNPESVMNVTERPDRLVLNIVSGADGTFNLYEDDGDNADYASQYAVTRLSQSHSGNKATYTVHARRGTYSEAPSERSYNLRIYDTTRPVSVSVNGKPTSWSYDAATRCTNIDIPKTSCLSDCIVEVEYSGATAVSQVQAAATQVSYDSLSRCLSATFGEIRHSVSLSVSDSNGRQMLQKMFSDTSRFSVDLSMFAPQLCVSKVVADGDIYVNKFVNR